MKRRPFDATRLLKFYPPGWRARYGDEFVAYVEDTLAGGRPSARFVLSIASGAVRERGHEAGLLGGHDASEQSRAGSLLVLCAWSVFMLAGASFSKMSEHSAHALPAGSGSLSNVSYDIVASCGALGMALVVVGACVALPTFVRFLRHGGWTSARRRIQLALALSVMVVGLIMPLALWAHHLTSIQRNGGDGAYSGAFVAYAALVALTLLSWDRVAVTCATAMTWPPRVLRAEALLAAAVSSLMIVITVGTAVWWAEIASNAPWFLQGLRSGASSSPFTSNVIVTLALMVLAASAGAFGLSRIARASRRA